MIYNSFKISKNKSSEIQMGKWKDWTNYVHLNIILSRRTDHAGFEIMIEICGFYLIFNVYDNRHWDYKNNCWEK
jgi:hypothetical protein